ncbi:unnamed protein product [Anisakis simplex]|uniref:C-type lectin domain-containing protein n=1 Tax=Anisakis simplex TaxID=6269 RepID=A0A0M3K273_ANISI|nr:unnamed protein product [Anisakis simplex]
MMQTVTHLKGARISFAFQLMMIVLMSVTCTTGVLTRGYAFLIWVYHVLLRWDGFRSVLRAIRRNGGLMYWNGLNVTGRWADGTVVGFTNWRASQPDGCCPFFPRPQCVLVNFANNRGLWDDAGCFLNPTVNSIRSVCKKAQGLIPVPPPDVAPRVCERGWTLNGRFCYQAVSFVELVERDIGLVFNISLAKVGGLMELLSISRNGAFLSQMAAAANMYTVLLLIMWVIMECGMTQDAEPPALKSNFFLFARKDR